MSHLCAYIGAMSENEITLEDLSERTGVEARTLRSWVSEGLLAPPFKTGRGARYPASNADRALAVRVLKDLHGLSLAEIGRRFMMATEDQIREWALEAGPTSAPRGSARDYLSRIQRRGIEPLSAQRSMDLIPQASFLAEPKPERAPTRPPLKSHPGLRGEDRTADLANIERLILQLEQVLETPAPRRSRGAIWTRISVTPDLELSVRGELEPRERILFEQLADQFRAILTGRTKND
jgi:DNA-binding transcriptional MerR regulator